MIKVYNQVNLKLLDKNDYFVKTSSLEWDLNTSNINLNTVIDIKLDKTGGLTEALLLKEKALSMNFEVMVGCMIGSSLAMAPAVLIAQDVKNISDKNSKV